MATTPPLNDADGPGGDDLPLDDPDDSEVATPGGLFDFKAARASATNKVHHPSLDGLRGVAVAMVLVYHHDAARLPGGFLGVDVFFVLSGFLITGLLLKDHASSGTVSFRRFWVGRARRLAPALLLTILMVVAYACLFAAPETLHRLRWDALAGLAQVANWRFVIDGQSYFFDFSPSPLRHLWSLAVEEQWYLLWPVVCLFLLGRDKVRPDHGVRLLLAGSIVLAVASTAAMAWMTRDGSDLSRAYYGTDTHAAGLLVGAALAALVRLRPGLAVGSLDPAPQPPGGAAAGGGRPLVVGVPAVAASMFIAAAAFELGGTSRVLYRGGFTLVAVASAFLVLACTAPGRSWATNPVARVLGLAPLRWLGLISYGVYLYHWPIYFVVTAERTGFTGPALLAVRFLVTVALATASYALVERPVRRGRLSDRSVLAGGAVAVATVAVLVVMSTAPGRQSLLLRPDLDVAARPAPAVPTTQPGTSPEEVPSRVLVVGDSVSFTLATGFERDDLAEELLVWNQGILYCELLDLPRKEAGELRQANEECGDWRGLWKERVAEFDPDVAVLHVGPWEVFDRLRGDTTLAWGSPELDALYLEALSDAVDILGEQGATVVLLASPPLDRTDGVSNPEWTLEERRRIHHLEALLVEVAESRTDDEVVVIDLGDLVCPNPSGGCPAEVDDVAPRGDGVHYTADGAEIAAAWLTPQLRSLALEAHSRRSG